MAGHLARLEGQFPDQAKHAPVEVGKRLEELTQESRERKALPRYALSALGAVLKVPLQRSIAVGAIFH